MKFHLWLFAAFFAATNVCADSPSVTDNDWPNWRGREHTGIADTDQQPPTSWSEEENVLWKVAIAGRGHASPTVLGDQVLLPTADHERKVQLIISFDRESGEQRWQSIVHEGGLETKGKRQPNARASAASSTIASDGERLFVNFFNDEAVWTTALSLDGKIEWQQKISDYTIHQGYGSSPFLHQDLVIVSADNKGGGAIVALKKTTGEIVWRHERPEKPNYVSPVVLNVGGREQLIMFGCDLVTSLNPTNGDTLWEIDGATTECVTTAVTDGTHVFTSGGYPKDHVAAVAADGSGVIWENNLRVYVPSMLQRDGFLFATLDKGIATCIRCADGHEMWKARLGGNFSSSPVMVGDLIYATNEDGVTYVFKANSDKFEKVGENQLGTSVFATPAICDGRIYTRVAHYRGDSRNEYLYCIGQTSAK